MKGGGYIYKRVGGHACANRESATGWVRFSAFQNRFCPLVAKYRLAYGTRNMLTLNTHTCANRADVRRKSETINDKTKSGWRSGGKMWVCVLKSEIIPPPLSILVRSYEAREILLMF